jgi:hypothetical protein
MSAAHKSDLVEISALYRMEKGAGIAIWDGERDGTGREVWTWLPASLVERDGDTFTMPEWLALQKGLL